MRAPKKGYTLLESLDPAAPPEGSYLKLKLLVASESDTDSHVLVPKRSGVRFVRLPGADVVQRVDWTPSGACVGAIKLDPVHAAQLEGQREALREAAVTAIKEHAAVDAARAAAREQKARVRARPHGRKQADSGTHHGGAAAASCSR